MSNFDYPDSATLFPNDYKKQPHQPDWKGEGNWNGQRIEIAGWNKVSRDGRQFISVKISHPYEREQQ